MTDKNITQIIGALLVGAALSFIGQSLLARDKVTISTQTYSAGTELENINEKLDGVIKSIDSLRSEMAGVAAANLHIEDSGATHSAVMTSNDNSSTCKKDAQQAPLSDNQRTLYEGLSQSIAYATDGSFFTMNLLQEQMTELPQAYQEKLLTQMAERINSGALDAQSFIEGTIGNK